MTKHQASVTIEACIKFCYFISAVTATINFQKSFLFEPPDQFVRPQIFNCLCLIKEQFGESLNRSERVFG